MRAVLTAYTFVVGACVGSFLNVVIARVPQRRSIVRPRSSCPRCGAVIAWYDNIPLLSWVLLRGRCRSCGLPISARYPTVELLTGILFVGLARRFGLSWTMGAYACFVAALLALTYIDLDTWLLPHQITWPLVSIGLLSFWWNPALHWTDTLGGAAAGFAAFAAVALFGEKVLGRETMGWGDVWLLAGIGAWLGWQSLLPVVMLAAVQGTIGGILMIALRKRPPAPAGKLASPAAGTPEGGGAGLPTPQSEPPRSVAAADSLSPDPAISSLPAAPLDDDWVPPPHAVPFGPFLALAALEVLLAGDWVSGSWFRLVGRLSG